MGLIGSFGKVIFEVSTEKVRTFDGFTRGSSTRLPDHEIIQKKPLTEFVGPELDVISFTMRFDAYFGVKPREEMEYLLELCRDGKAEILIIGGKALGMDKWVITELKQNWNVVDNLGNVIIGTADVTLKEYISEVG